MVSEKGQRLRAAVISWIVGLVVVVSSLTGFLLTQWGYWSKNGVNAEARDAIWVTLTVLPWVALWGWTKRRPEVACISFIGVGILLSLFRWAEPYPTGWLTWETVLGLVAGALGIASFFRSSTEDRPRDIW